MIFVESELRWVEEEGIKEPGPSEEALVVGVGDCSATNFGNAGGAHSWPLVG